MVTMQKVYHKLQEWIFMLDAKGFEDEDAELVRKQMMEFCGEIWLNRDNISSRRIKSSKAYLKCKHALRELRKHGP